MRRVLVVDDEPEIVEILSRFLNFKGYFSLKAFGGREAIDILKTQEVDLILLDIKMPQVDGIQVLRTIKDLDKKPKVLVMSGSLDLKRYVQKLKQLGYSEENFLVKPVRLEEVVRKIDDIFEE